MRNTNNGLGHEATIIKLFGMTKSSHNEDYLMDIDAYLHGHSVSIKCQSDHFHNFAVEVRQENTSNGDWIDGWYHSGRAEVYSIGQRDRSDHLHTVFVVPKTAITKYIDKHNPHEVKSLRAALDNSGREYDLPIVKLIPMDYIEKVGKKYIRKSTKG